MLTYLDALIAALTIRDTTEVERLLDHPLARILPAAARDEAIALGRGEADALAAPLRVMQLRHQTAELLRDAPVTADAADLATDAAAGPAEIADAPRAPRRHTPERKHRPARLVQMELPLSA